MQFYPTKGEFRRTVIYMLQDKIMSEMPFYPTQKAFCKTALYTM